MHWKRGRRIRDALPVWGGTDVMVELNFARSRPEALLDLTRVGGADGVGAKLTAWLRIGAGVSYTRAIAELGAALPGLAMASRTVGSPQIRNRGTIGGNLGSSSPAGDALPPLYASGADGRAGVGAGRRGRCRSTTSSPARSATCSREDELIAGCPHAAGARAAAVLEDRHAQRDGDRGLLVRA